MTLFDHKRFLPSLRVAQGHVFTEWHAWQKCDLAAFWHGFGVRFRPYSKQILLYLSK